MTVDIAVVVPTYRRPAGLRRLLGALARQTLPADRWELLVVDDQSKEPEVEAVLSELGDCVPATARALRTPANGGPAVARNVGWRATRAPIVAFLDDDVVPEPAWLAGGLAAFTDPDVGVVQGFTTLPQGVDQFALAAWSLWRRVEGPGPFFEACNIFYRRAALERTSGFDEELAWWGEDTTLGWQVVERGWGRAFAEEAAATHDVERRGLGWFVRNGWREHHVVALGARHPGYRAEAFWRPWAFRRRDALFALAAVSAAAGLRWRPALAGVIPYALFARPSLRKPQLLRLWGGAVAVDAARTAGHLAGALRHRTLVV